MIFADLHLDPGARLALPPHDELAVYVIEGEVDRVGGSIIDKSPTEVGRCVVTGNRQQVQCTNARSRKGTYKYTVLLEQGGKALPAFDPYIVNKE